MQGPPRPLTVRGNIFNVRPPVTGRPSDRPASKEIHLSFIFSFCVLLFTSVLYTAPPSRETILSGSFLYCFGGLRLFASFVGGNVMSDSCLSVSLPLARTRSRNIVVPCVLHFRFSRTKETKKSSWILRFILRFVSLYYDSIWVKKNVSLHLEP